MKKQLMKNGKVQDAKFSNKFIDRLEQTTSVIDFYNLKEKIIEELKK